MNRDIKHSGRNQKSKICRLEYIKHAFKMTNTEKLKKGKKEEKICKQCNKRLVCNVTGDYTNT